MESKSRSRPEVRINDDFPLCFGVLLGFVDVSDLAERIPKMHKLPYAYVILEQLN